jgi:hypothetical protein
MSEFNALQTLEERGLIPASPEGHLVEGHQANAARQVLSTLTRDEVEVLASIRERMTAASVESDVEGHVIDVNGYVLW